MPKVDLDKLLLDLLRILLDKFENFCLIGKPFLNLAKINSKGLLSNKLLGIDSFGFEQHTNFDLIAFTNNASEGIDNELPTGSRFYFKAGFLLGREISNIKALG